MSELNIILTDFEGPLDLLLHLIKQSKIDIYDIPIAEVTQQYIDYLNKMKKLELDIAGDYLVMASTLMSIKSKLLLPQNQYSDDDFVETDPREDLVAQLLTYQTFKKASTFFAEKENNRRQYFSKEISLPNTDIKPFLKPNSVLVGDLAAAMADVLKRQKLAAPVAETINDDNFTIEQAQSNILQKLSQLTEKDITFKKLLSKNNSVNELVTTFMAMLELVKEKLIDINQKYFGEDIFVSLRSNIDEISG